MSWLSPLDLYVDLLEFQTENSENEYYKQRKESAGLFYIFFLFYKTFSFFYDVATSNYRYSSRVIILKSYFPRTSESLFQKEMRRIKKDEQC